MLKDFNDFNLSLYRRSNLILKKLVHRYRLLLHKPFLKFYFSLCIPDLFSHFLCFLWFHIFVQSCFGKGFFWFKRRIFQTILIFKYYPHLKLSFPILEFYLLLFILRLKIYGHFSLKYKGLSWNISCDKLFVEDNFCLFSFMSRSFNLY
jgi:hypothetical protein